MMSWHRIWAYIVRHLYEILATFDRKFDIIFWPTVDLLIFGFLSVYIKQINGQASIAGAIIGALILWDLVFNIQRDITVTLLEDAWSRNLYNLYSTPLKMSEMLIGTLLLSTLKAVITISLVTFLASSIFGFNFLSIGPIFAFYLFNIFIFGWAFGCLTASLIFRFGLKLQIFTWSLVALIYPISGVFYPLSVLPSRAAFVAKLLPISYIFENLRSLLIFHVLPSDNNLMLIFFLNIFYFVVGIWLFSRGFKNAKERGWFVHPT